MLERSDAPAPWIERFVKVMGRFVPDAVTAAVGMMVLLAAAALLVGNTVAQTAEAYYRGLWMLLPFTMQMSLIIVLSSVLGASPLFRRLILAVARLPKTPNQVVILSVLIAGTCAYAYWGLGIALSPIIAVYFAREAERKGIPVDFLFLLGVVLGANALWQFGLSASAPLLVATPGHFLEKTIGVIPLSRTIWSPAAIVLEMGYAVAVMVVGCWAMPKRCRQVSEFPAAERIVDPPAAEGAGEHTWSEKLERSYFVTPAICVALVVWLWVHFGVKGLSLDINSLNTFLLLGCFLLHRTVFRFTGALQKAIVAAWPVIVMYHIYAGVAGLIQFTTTGEKLAGVVASVSSPLTFPLLTAFIGAVFSIFIPSSGGQWAIQGFVTVRAAQEVGFSIPGSLLAMSVGDHVGNLTSPFWYVIVAGIAQVDFRNFFGYGLLFAVLWFVLGVLAFTFLPC
ncbi:MAG: short-chain fatty acid transporter [Acidobacteria bacterium]|nr:short-chain fatty acid transporter [Acidobacteriota bacterium]